MADLPDPRLFHPPTAQELLDQLEAAVVAEGGRALTEACRPKPIFYQRPENLPSSVRFRAQPSQATCACGNETRLMIPADPAAPLDVAPLRVCAICDALLYWPRYMT